MDKLQQDWNEQGDKFFSEINAMFEFAQKHGWDAWKGEEPKDTRAKLAGSVFDKLKKANKENNVAAFREAYPPAHAPFVGMLNKKAQNIFDLTIIDENRIAFLVGGYTHKEQTLYIVNGKEITKGDDTICSIGKSHNNNYFAFCYTDKTIIRQGWNGEITAELQYPEFKEPPYIVSIHPYNHGKKAILNTQSGIYLISENEPVLLNPENTDDLEKGEEIYIDMNHAALSPDNTMICVGDQGSTHIIFNEKGEKIGDIGNYSEYPHFALFAQDNSHLIMNSCHFYNGCTIGIDQEKINGFESEMYDREQEDLTVVNDFMRVYCGVAHKDYYILGEAYGYIRAYDKKGTEIWKYYLGSTITSMAISDNFETLYIGSSSGMLHKLQLNKGLRSNHVIATGDHYEDYRLIFWKGEEQAYWW